MLWKEDLEGGRALTVYVPCFWLDACVCVCWLRVQDTSQGAHTYSYSNQTQQYANPVRMPLSAVISVGCFFVGHIFAEKAAHEIAALHSATSPSTGPSTVDSTWQQCSK